MKSKADMTPWEEHLFWLEVLQDHAYFARDHLPVIYKAEVDAAQWYIEAFGERILELGGVDPAGDAGSPALKSLAASIWPVAEGYFRFEGRLQSMRIMNELTVNLSPTYFNGTLGENQEYLRLLHAYVQGRNPEPQPLWALLDLWLEDQLGHAVLLRNITDPIEVGILAKADEFSRMFQGYILQNHQIRGYLRFTPPGMPRQLLLASEVGQTTLAMNLFIRDVIRRYREDKYLNRTTLRFLEHHLPEACYFVRKLSRYAPELDEAASACSIRRVGEFLSPV